MAIAASGELGREKFVTFCSYVFFRREGQREKSPKNIRKKKVCSGKCVENLLIPYNKDKFRDWT